MSKTFAAILNYLWYQHFKNESKAITKLLKSKQFDPKPVSERDIQELIEWKPEKENQDE